MKPSSRRKIPILLAGAGLLALAACDPAEVTRSVAPSEPLALVDDSAARALNLLYCPTSQDREVEREIGPGGGVIEVEGHRLTVPAGAVTANTRFRVRVRDSDYLEVEFRAKDLPQNRFQTPVEIQLSYARCAELYPSLPRLSAWHVDEATLLPREFMGGTLDAERQTVTFQTSHFSVYALAN